MATRSNLPINERLETPRSSVALNRSSDSPQPSTTSSPPYDNRSLSDESAYNYMSGHPVIRLTGFETDVEDVAARTRETFDILYNSNIVLSNRVAQVEGGLGGLTRAIMDLTTSIHELTGKVGRMDTAISSMNTEIKKIRTQVNSLGEQVNSLDTAMVEVKITLSGIEAAGDFVATHVSSFVLEPADTDSDVLPPEDALDPTSAIDRDDRPARKAKLTFKLPASLSFLGSRGMKSTPNLTRV